MEGRALPKCNGTAVEAEGASKSDGRSDPPQVFWWMRASVAVFPVSHNGLSLVEEATEIILICDCGTVRQ